MICFFPNILPADTAFSNLPRSALRQALPTPQAHPTAESPARTSFCFRRLKHSRWLRRRSFRAGTYCVGHSRNQHRDPAADRQKQGWCGDYTRSLTLYGDVHSFYLRTVHPSWSPKINGCCSTWFYSGDAESPAEDLSCWSLRRRGAAQRSGHFRPYRPPILDREGLRVRVRVGGSTLTLDAP